jgi:hypothetical protein
MNTRSLATATSVVVLPLLLAGCGTTVKTQPAIKPIITPVTVTMAPVAESTEIAPLAITPSTVELSSVETPVITGGHTSIYGEAEVTVHSGGSATLELVDASGTPLAGLILVAGDAPGADTINSFLAANTDRGQTWHCETVVADTLVDLRLQIVDGTHLSFAGLTPSTETGFVMPVVVSPLDISAGLVVVGTNTTLTGTAGDVDQPARSNTDLMR